MSGYGVAQELSGRGTSPRGSADIIPALMMLASSTKLGPYEIAGQLGAGGTGRSVGAKEWLLGKFAICYRNFRCSGRSINDELQKTG